MHKAHDVLGLPVMDLSTGSHVGEVHDLLFDSNDALNGVVVQSKGWLHRRQFVPSKHICAFGEDCVTIPDQKVLTSLRKDSSLKGLVTGDPLKGKNVVTRNGEQLGQVKDVYFGEELGTIVGYELSDGFLTDVMEGRRILSHPGWITYGKDALIVPVAKGTSKKV